MASSQSSCIPTLRELNHNRARAYQEYMDEENSYGRRVCCWFVHRGLTVACIPANAVSGVVRSIGVVALAACKIVGCGTEESCESMYCECCFSWKQFRSNLEELVYEYVIRFKRSSRAVVSPPSCQSSLVADSRREIDDFYVEEEWEYDDGLEDFLPGVRWLNSLRIDLRREISDTRYTLSRQMRRGKSCAKNTFKLLGERLAHGLLSVVVLPANAVAAVASLSWAIVSSALVVSKVALYTFAGLAIKQSTGHVRARNACIASSKEFVAGICDIVKDVFGSLLGFYSRLRMSGRSVVSPIRRMRHMDMSVEAPSCLNRMNNKRRWLHGRIEDLQEELSIPELVATGHADLLIKQIGKHALLSAVVMPVNLIAGLASLGWMTVSSVLVVSKVALYTLTGIAIQQSTGFEWAKNNVYYATEDLLYNMGDSLKDIATLASLTLAICRYPSSDERLA